jgi:hypothetical protein
MRTLPGLLALAIALVASPLIGCATTGSGSREGAAAWADGALTGSAPAAPPAVVHAAEWAVKDMGFQHVSSRDSDAGGLVRGRTGDGEDIEVSVTRTGDHRCDVVIRFGAFGEEPLSRALLKRIRDRLAE